MSLRKPKRLLNYTSSFIFTSCYSEFWPFLFPSQSPLFPIHLVKQPKNQSFLNYVVESQSFLQCQKESKGSSWFFFCFCFLVQVELSRALGNWLWSWVLDISHVNRCSYITRSLRLLIKCRGICVHDFCWMLKKPQDFLMVVNQGKFISDGLAKSHKSNEWVLILLSFWNWLSLIEYLYGPKIHS